MPKRISTKLGRVPLNGHLNFTAVRATYAFNEKFSLIAAKDGYIDFKPEHTLEHDSGWGDIAARFKVRPVLLPAGRIYCFRKTAF